MVKSFRIIVIVGGLTLAAVLLGFYLVPSRQEIALMQMDDSNFNTAMKNYTALQAESNTSINVLTSLISLDIYYGDVDKAIAILESYIAEHPRSIEARKKLAQLYKASQRFNRYCAMLEELQQLSPSLANLRELADIYDFLGRNADEMRILAELVKSKGYKPQGEDYIMLASFYRVHQEPERALAVITDYLKDSDYKVDIEAAILAVQLWLEHGKIEKAVSLASDYLEKSNNETYAVQLSTLFETMGHFNEALAILRPFLDIPKHSVVLDQQVVDLMLAQKKDDIVFNMLAERFAREGSLPPSLATNLADLAIERSNFVMVERLIKAEDLEKMPEEALFRYVEVTIFLSRPDLAQLIESKLSKSYLEEAPVFTTILHLAIADTPQNVAALSALPDNIILTPETKIILANLYMKHGLPNRAFALLDNMAISDVLDAFDAELYAQIYLAGGAGDRAEQILAKARLTSPREMQDSIDQIILLLSAGEGKVDYVRQRLANYKGSDSDFWPDAYDLAVEYHHENVALLIAQQLFQIDPSIPNRIQYAETLLLNNRAAEALSFIADISLKDNAAARMLYLDALALSTDKSGSKVVLSEQEKTALATIMDTIQNNPDIDADEKRDLAYVLEKIGFREQAENLLMKLAEGQSPDNTDVEDLLDFWQLHPSNHTKEWIVNRFHQAPTTQEKALWLTALNDMNYPQTVLEAVRNERSLPAVLEDQVLEALVSIHNQEKLKLELERAIETESNSARVRKLATIAEDEDIAEAAELGWRKLYALNPNDPEANRALGLLAFDAGRMEEAEPLLAKYLQQDHEHDQGDYRASYAYAEILQQDEKKDEAKAYYEEALKQLSVIKDKNKDILVDEAYLLYHNDKLQQSVDLFHELLAKDPADKSLRADFAEMLMETGRMDEATKVLSAQ